MNNLINISKEWKFKADKIIDEKDLVKTLSAFGSIEFTGSYFYDLMMHGDVDIMVFKEKSFSKEEVFEIFKVLYFGDKFKSCFIKGDWDDIRIGNEFPNGHYIGLKDKVDGEKWKFDLWFVNEDEFEKRNNNLNLKNISEEQKEFILVCKKYRNENGLKVSSQEIYNNVLNCVWKMVDDMRNI